MTQPPDTPPPDTPPTETVPPRPRRFLRSRRDRFLGGVCGGLGEYFAVDPILFRVAAVVLAVVGGFALLAYPVLWIFVPRDDGTGNPEPLRIWRLFGSADGTAPPAGRIVAGIVGIVLALVAAVALFVAAGWVTALGGGVIVASVVVVLGFLAIAGAIAGKPRARWLVLPALLLALPSGVVAAAGVKFEGGYGERDYRPGSAAALPHDGYKLSAGSMWIDLRDANLPRDTTTRVPVKIGMGEATVIVPDTVCVQADAKAGAGVVNVLGHQHEGFDVDYDLSGATSGAPRLVLDADVGMGAFEVVHDPSEARFGGPHQSWGPPGFHRDDGDRFPQTNRACTEG
jgi:phage shock protein PspC (stress-responsive transcriptional regulator)